jgi:YD repeat-containing protein
MKKTIMASWMLFTVMGFMSCKKESSPANPASNCKLTDILTSGRADMQTADPYSFTTTDRIEYNDKNLESGYSSQTSYKYNSNKTASYSSSYNYQYDVNGFLIKQISQGSTNDKAGNYGTSTYTTTYEYANSRLTKTTASGISTANGKTTNSTGTTTYEYTADGKLSKYANAYSSSDGSSSSSFTLYEYSNGKLSKISYSSGAGIITPLIEFNSQGLLTKTVTATAESRFQYDAEGNQVRQEQWSGGKKTDIRIYTLDSKQNAYTLVYPRFKGHPDFSFYVGHNSSRVFTHNVIKDERIYVDPLGIEKPDGSFVYTYQYNGSNLPSAADAVYTDSNGKISQQFSISYTYSGCQ